MDFDEIDSSLNELESMIENNEIELVTFKLCKIY